MFFFNDIQPIGNNTENSFDSIKQIDANGNEFWYARDLQAILEYTKWDNFLNVIEKAKIACQNSELSISDHFADVGKIVHVGVANRTPQDFAKFHNSGYQGLYGGLGNKEIHKRKGLKPSQKILDHMGSEELAANLFRLTQTEGKLRRDNIQGKENANIAHREVGAKVRQTIKELGGTMPEDLPTPPKSIKQLEKEQKKLEKK